MIDHRGHGRGLRPRGPFRLEDCADDVVALLDVLGIARAAAVGYSMGGPIAQLLWRRHPTRVEGLVLCATSRNFGGGRHARVFYGGLATGGAALTFAPAAMRGLIMDRFLKARLDDPDVAWMAEEYRYGDPALIMQAGGALGRFNSAPWISEVDVPTAVIVTTEDTVVSPERQRKLAAAIPRAVVFEVAGDHRSCVARPDLFVPQLVAACQHVTRRPPVR